MAPNAAEKTPATPRPLCFDSKRLKTVAASRVTGVGWDFLLGWLQSHALAIKLGRALRPTEGDSGVFSS
jgi:hypothetical protein